MCISAQDYIFNVQNFYSCTPLRASDSINLYPTLLASLHKFFSYATKIRRGDRFYIDDGDSEDDHPIYEATKIDRITRMYNGNGVYTLMLVECNEHPTDNSDSMVADNNNKTELEEGEWVYSNRRYSIDKFVSEECKGWLRYVIKVA